jgi:hypothetical protein
MVRFLFRGIVRETGKPVEGHVEAVDSNAAFNVLGDNGIVTESLREDPKQLNMSPSAVDFPQFADALESALDSSSSQVSFDDLAPRYSGKKVWVIDRDKIRMRVAQVVDSTLAASEANFEGASEARQRVANAIQGLFNDNRNIATEHNAASIAGMRVPNIGAGTGNAAHAMNNLNAMNSDILDQQINRLSDVVRQVEGLVGAMASAFRSIGSGGQSRRRAAEIAPSTGEKQNEVLLEIFKSNLDLRREMDRTGAQSPTQTA